jgi:hypothetical protein
MSLASRPAMMRDPASPSGGIFVSTAEQANTNPKAATGSQYFSAQVAGDWQVVNAKGVVSGGGPYATEQLAANAAAAANSPATSPVPKLEVSRG